MGPKGHVKFFRSSNVGVQLKAVRHGNHEKVDVYGVWWCESEPSAKRLKERIDGLLKETYTPSPGAGFYQMAVPGQMAQVAVELAAGEIGVVLISPEQRELWLFDQVKKAASQAPRGL